MLTATVTFPPDHVPSNRPTANQFEPGMSELRSLNSIVDSNCTSGVVSILDGQDLSVSDIFILKQASIPTTGSVGRRHGMGKNNRVGYHI